MSTTPHPTAANPDRARYRAPGAPLRLYSSYERAQVEFASLTGDQTVSMYTCGPTVYGEAHLGNLRAYVFADTLRRALAWKGYTVTQVLNITDVGHLVGDGDDGEDKVELAARRARTRVEEVTGHYTTLFLDALKKLNVLAPTHLPRASGYVPQMVAFAERLEERGHAYQLDSGLYFDTASWAGHAALTSTPADEARATGRVDVTEKRQAADFALWRSENMAATDGPRRLQSWESPWGSGVPGWHLECSVMAMELLGETFDVHTGGVDHREIHHVNEIAQSQAYRGQPDGTWVPLWMHNEFLLVSGAKISKSAGRVPTLRDLDADAVPAAVYRYFLLTSSYRHQVNLEAAALEAASAGWTRLLTRIRDTTDLVEELTALTGAGARSPEGLLTYAGAASLLEDETPAHDRETELLVALDAAISDDLGTARVLGLLSEIVRTKDLPARAKAVLLAAADTLLGLGLSDPATLQALDSNPDDELTALVEPLLVARAEAREARDWARADALRTELAALGVTVKDTPDGTVWTH